MYAIALFFFGLPLKYAVLWPLVWFCFANFFLNCNSIARNSLGVFGLACFLLDAGAGGV
jgi:hypothetical protein